MKRLFVLFSSLFILLCTVPNQAQAQCPSNADSDPTYALPTGSNVCDAAGKLQWWVAAPIIQTAQSTLAQEFPSYTFQEYVWAYYRTEDLHINYLGGTWANGQSFKVTMGGAVVIVISTGDI